MRKVAAVPTQHMVDADNACTVNRLSTNVYCSWPLVCPAVGTMPWGYTFLRVSISQYISVYLRYSLIDLRYSLIDLRYSLIDLSYISVYLSYISVLP